MVPGTSGGVRPLPVRALAAEPPRARYSTGPKGPRRVSSRAPLRLPGAGVPGSGERAAAGREPSQPQRPPRDRSSRWTIRVSGRGLPSSSYPLPRGLARPARRARAAMGARAHRAPGPPGRCRDPRRSAFEADRHPKGSAHPADAPGGRRLLRVGTPCNRRDKTWRWPRLLARRPDRFESCCFPARRRAVTACLPRTPPRMLCRLQYIPPDAGPGQIRKSVARERPPPSRRSVFGASFRSGISRCRRA